MSLLGEAIEAVCKPKRVNYEIAGNLDPYVHAHVFPRYDWEPAEYSRGPVGRYPREQRNDPQREFSAEAHGELKAQLAAKLRELMDQANVGVR